MEDLDLLHQDIFKILKDNFTEIPVFYFYPNYQQAKIKQRINFTIDNVMNWQKGNDSPVIARCRVVVWVFDIGSVRYDIANQIENLFKTQLTQGKVYAVAEDSQFFDDEYNVYGLQINFEILLKNLLNDN